MPYFTQVRTAPQPSSAPRAPRSRLIRGAAAAWARPLRGGLAGDFPPYVLHSISLVLVPACRLESFCFGCAITIIPIRRMVKFGKMSLG